MPVRLSLLIYLCQTLGIRVTKIDQFNGHKQSVYTLSKADENSFFSAGGDGMVVHWRCKEKDGFLLAQIPAPIFCSYFDPASKTLWVGTNQGEIYILDTHHKLLKNKLKVDTNALFSLYFDGEVLYAAGHGGRLLTLDAHSLDLLKFLKISEKSIRQIEPYKDELLLPSSDGFVYAYSPKEHSSRSLGKRSEMSVFCVRMLNENLFTTGRDARIHVWEKEKEVQDINAHWYTINDLAFNPDASLLASSSMDKSIKLWDPKNMELLKVIDKERLNGHHSSVNKLIWLTENRLVSCSDDRSVQLFDIQHSK